MGLPGEVLPDIFRTIGNVTADLAVARIREGRDVEEEPPSGICSGTLLSCNQCRVRFVNVNDARVRTGIFNDQSLADGYGHGRRAGVRPCPVRRAGSLQSR
jgi:hypothetical protein